MPLLIYFLWAPRRAPPIIVNVGTLAIALLVIYKHDANFQRLVEGTEPRFSFSRKKETDGQRSRFSGPGAGIRRRRSCLDKAASPTQASAGCTPPAAPNQSVETVKTNRI